MSGKNVEIKNEDLSSQIAKVDQRVEKVEAELPKIVERIKLEEKIDARFEKLEAKFDAKFDQLTLLITSHILTTNKKSQE